MSLVNDINTFLNGRNLPPYEVADELSCEIVSDELYDTGRWNLIKVAVFARDGKYAEMVYYEPATEMQDWSDWEGSPAYKVIPVEVKTVKYVKV